MALDKWLKPSYPQFPQMIIPLSVEGTFEVVCASTSSSYSQWQVLRKWTQWFVNGTGHTGLVTLRI